MKRSLVYGSMAVALVASIGMAQSVTIDNGVVGDGHLAIGVDGYGGYSNWGWATNLDHYDPVGPYVENSPMFAGWFGLYSNGTERVAFAEPFFDIDNTYNLRSSTFGLPTASNVQVNGAGDTATSAWSSATDPNFGAILTMSFDFALVQTVSGSAGAPATLTQALTITNTGVDPVDIEIQRHLDIDTLFFNNTFQDVVGTVDAGGTIIPYQRPADGDLGPTNPATLGLSSPDPFNYLAGKAGFDGGGGTVIAFGTDFQIWDNFGYPLGWSNYTSGIGHSPLTGELPGAQPAGSATPWDAFLNIEWRIHIEPGASATVTAVLSYGEAGGGGGCPCACNMDLTTGPGVCDLFDFLAFQGGFVAGETCQCDIDTTTGVGVCDLFDFLAFQGAFVQGCP